MGHVIQRRRTQMLPQISSQVEISVRMDKSIDPDDRLHVEE